MPKTSVTPDNYAMGRRMYTARLMRFIPTQKDLADMLHVAPQAGGQGGRGENGIDPHIAQQLACVLGVPASILMYGVQPPITAKVECLQVLNRADNLLSMLGGQTYQMDAFIDEMLPIDREFLEQAAQIDDPFDRTTDMNAALMASMKADFESIWAYVVREEHLGLLNDDKSPFKDINNPDNAKKLERLAEDLALIRISLSYEELVAAYLYRTPNYDDIKGNIGDTIEKQLIDEVTKQNVYT